MNPVQNNPVKRELCVITRFRVAEDFEGKVLTDMMTDARPAENIATYESGRRASHQLMQIAVDEA